MESESVPNGVILREDALRRIEHVSARGVPAQGALHSGPSKHSSPRGPRGKTGQADGHVGRQHSKCRSTS